MGIQGVNNVNISNCHLQKAVDCVSLPNKRPKISTI